jgi:hypothetical protein
MGSRRFSGAGKARVRIDAAGVLADAVCSRRQRQVPVLEKTKKVIRSLSIRLVLRIILGVLLILVGFVLLFLPGQGLLLILLGLVVLGFTVDDIVDVCRKVIPGFTEERAEAILNHRFLRPFRRKKWASLLRKRKKEEKPGEGTPDS